jgi:hypothetical protein
MAENNAINNRSSTLTVDNGFVVTTGTTTINSGTSALGISTDASATTVNIATGAAVKTTVLGSTNSTSATTVQSGSGACNLGTTGTGATNMGNGTGTTSIQFGTGGALNSYATGVWTPTIVGTVAGITTYTTQEGSYIKIGQLVFIRANLAISAATGTGNAIFGGFPFTIQNISNGDPIGEIIVSAAGWAWPAGATTIAFRGTANTTQANAYGYASTVANAALQMTNAGAIFRFSLVYISTT